MSHGLLSAARRWQEARTAEASAGIDDRVDKIKAADLQKVHFQRMLRLTPSRAVADLLTQLEARATEAELEAARLRGIELLNEERCREIHLTARAAITKELQAMNGPRSALCLAVDDAGRSCRKLQPHYDHEHIFL